MGISRIMAAGSVYSVDQVKYCCYHNSRKLCRCDGQATYQADRIDAVICQMTRQIFQCMKGAPEEEKLQELFKRQMAGNRASQKRLGIEIGRTQEQLAKLQLEIGRSLTGDSVYSAEDLAQAIRSTKERLVDAEKQLRILKAEEADKKTGD